MYVYSSLLVHSCNLMVSIYVFMFIAQHVLLARDRRLVCAGAFPTRRQLRDDGHRGRGALLIAELQGQRPKQHQHVPVRLR